MSGSWRLDVELIEEVDCDMRKGKVYETVLHEGHGYKYMYVTGRQSVTAAMEYRQPQVRRHDVGEGQREPSLRRWSIVSSR